MKTPTIMKYLKGMTDQEYIDKLNKLAEGTTFPPSPPIIRSGINLLQCLRNGPVFVPVVSNASGVKGPYYISTKSKDSAAPTQTKYDGKRVYLHTVEGKGMYSRVEELFQMDAIEVLGMHTIERKFQSGVSRYTCYVIKLK